MDSESSRLPIELCERVIDVAGGEPWRSPSGGRVDYAALRACALVCRAWAPRARHNLFFRVGLRTARELKLFLDVAATGQRTREVELTLPLRTPGPRPVAYRTAATAATESDKAHRECASLGSPLLAAAARAVRVLALHYSEWLYPRAYIRLLGAQFAAVTTLELYCVTFTTGGDLARVVWGFPNLRSVRCGIVVVKYGGTRTLPVVTPGIGVACRRVSDLRINGCSSIAPFILKTVTAGSAPIATLSLRSSFARWAPDGFESFSSFGRLRTLRVVLASPAVFSPLPLKSSLLEVYSKATRRILSSIASSNTLNEGLRLIDIACEPGSGRWRYLCGTRPAGDVETNAHANADVHANTTVRSVSECSRPAGSEELQQYTYEQKRSVAMGMLLGGVEDILLEGGDLRKPFAGLRVLNIRLWDPPGGKDDSWWRNEVARSLPALHARGILSPEVIRTSYVGGGPLWDPEDE